MEKVAKATKEPEAEHPQQKNNHIRNMLNDTFQLLILTSSTPLGRRA
jgi:hypothetical protein